jgi:hypothetical protein
VDAPRGDGAVRRAAHGSHGVAPAHAWRVPGRDRRWRQGGRGARRGVRVGGARGVARPGAVRALGHRLQDEPRRRRLAAVEDGYVGAAAVRRAEALVAGRRARGLAVGLVAGAIVQAPAWVCGDCAPALVLVLPCAGAARRSTTIVGGGTT